ncbi:MAG: undecaprenyl-diphosphatase, partial [Thiotrichales bacterium]|nr:undecaprenyl-diphosphatase [Thiotrichales bacterium]
GTLFSAVSAYISIHYFLALLDRVGMLPFVLYRLLLGVALFAIY